MAIPDNLPAPEVFYDPWSGAKSYFVKNSRGSYIPVNEGNRKSFLQEKGISAECAKNEPLSPVQRFLNETRLKNDVEYAGPLAGFCTGVYEIQNRRVLVTESPRFIDGKDGQWETLRKLLSNLLGDGQTPFLYGWLQAALASLRAGKRRPGQALVVAGAAGCGKSLLQNLITRILGGRSAKPYQYLTGATQFNSEMFHAEHLMIEDEAADFDFRVRCKLGTNLKGLVADDTQRCHPKNRPALTLTPFWRVSIHAE